MGDAIRITALLVALTLGVYVFFLGCAQLLRPDVQLVIRLGIHVAVWTIVSLGAAVLIIRFVRFVWRTP